ncbi:MAG: hypothetical protein L6R48_10425 [Planctomycetes bacterium]|nr:hypothetical protein [Planctomycetota bacterium]
MAERIRNPLPQLALQRIERVRLRVAERRIAARTALEVRSGPVNDPPVALAVAQGQPQAPVRPGEHFGPAGGGWAQRWFAVAVPAGPEGRRLAWRCQGEATAWIDGQPWAGLDVAHPDCPLPARALTVWIDAGAWQTGLWAPGATPIGPAGCRFDGCEAVLTDAAAEEVLADLDALVQLAQHLAQQHGLRWPASIGRCDEPGTVSPLLRHLLGGLDRAADAFTSGGLGALAAALTALRAALPAERWQPQAALVGHSHLDLVYLWPESITERKRVHTWATVLRLMEEDPAFTFTQSMPALYRACERESPGQFAAVRQRIAEGRWELLGGFEVEPDTHMPCGEALLRGLVIGQEYARAVTGSISRTCWMPDCFGYSACLPALLAQGGITAFCTSKLAWSAVTRFPYTSFRWRGADGSEVVSHLVTRGYAGGAEAERLVESAREHLQSDVHPEFIAPTGYGDGGGGPTPEMLRRARRYADLGGVPAARWERVEPVMARLEARRAELPVWEGELYLEFHRGVLTSQRRFKSVYRRLERALQAHEAAHAAAGLGPIPQEPWLRLCAAQFHDALPGTSIALVYQQMTPELERLAEQAEAAAAAALGGAGSGWFNPLPQELALAEERDGRAWLRRLPALAVAPADAALEPVAAVEASPQRLANGLVEARFDGQGRLAALSVDDDALPMTEPGHFALHDDFPRNYDAWDIDHYTLAHPRPVALGAPVLVEAGPARAVLRSEAALGERSRLVVDHILEAGSRWLRLECRVAWAERHQLLKWYAPTACAGRLAWFGCPFGAVGRSQHPAGAVEEAQWEVPGARWAAVTDDDGEGLAIAAEASWGFSARDGVLGLSLLRAPTFPDPECDQGDQLIRFALGRHRRRSEPGRPSTAAAADALFTAPLRVAGPAWPSPLALDAAGSLVPAWVQPTADGCTLRLHEAAGQRGSALLRTGTARRAALVDGFGAVRQELTVTDGAVSLPYVPGQILGVRLWR